MCSFDDVYSKWNPEKALSHPCPDQSLPCLLWKLKLPKMESSCNTEMLLHFPRRPGREHGQANSIIGLYTGYAYCIRLHYPDDEHQAVNTKQVTGGQQKRWLSVTSISTQKYSARS